MKSISFSLLWVGTCATYHVATAQNVGIGNAAPHAPLQFANNTVNRKIVLYEHVNNDHEFYGFGLNGGVLRYQTATVADDHVFYSGANAFASQELLRIKGNGMVGIGVSNPEYLLDVNGRMRLRSGGNDINSAGLWLNNNSNTQLQAFMGIYQSNVGFFGGNAGWGLMMSTETGNVGIGNNLPFAPLSFKQALGKKISLYPGPLGDAGFGVWANELRIQSDYHLADITFGYDDYGSGFQEKMRIKGSGNVGIGTTSPTRKLTVNGNLILNLEIQKRMVGVDEVIDFYYPQILYYIGANYHGGLGYLQENYFSFWDKNDYNILGINVPQKKIGILELNPLHRLDIGGRIFLRKDFENDESAGLWLGNSTGFKNAFIGNRSDTEAGLYGNTGTPNWRFFVNTTNGNAWLQGSLTQNSDVNLKKNIEPIADACKIIQQLHGYRYQWKDENADAEKQLGLLAQEVQKVLPELVKEGENGKLGVNYSGLIPVLLEALKEQQDEIKNLKQQITQIIQQVK